MSAHTKRLSLTKLVGQVPHEPNCLATLKEFLASPDVCYICNRFASVSLLLWNLQFPSQCARVQFHCCTAMVSFGELRTPIGDLNVFEIGTTILRESRYTYIYIYIYIYTIQHRRLGSWPLVLWFWWPQLDQNRWGRNTWPSSIQGKNANFPP